MIKKILIVCLTMLLCFFIGSFSVSAGVGSNGSGGNTGNNNGGGCPALRTKGVICSNSGAKIGVKLTLVYYNAKTKKRSIVNKDNGKTNTNSVVVINTRGNGGSWCPGRSNFICIGNGKYNHWFRINGDYGFNSKEIFKGIIGGTSASLGESNETLSYWLKLMGIDYETLRTRLQKYESCSVDGVVKDHEGRCYGKSGYRIVIEPVLQGHRKNNGSLEMFTIRKFGEISSWDKDNIYKASDNFSRFGKGMYVDFSDINIKYTKGTSVNTVNKLMNCLKTKTCGYGYNVVDIGQAFDRYKCKDVDVKNNECRIVRYINSTKKWKKVVDVKCDKYSASNSKYKAEDGKTYKLERNCSTTPPPNIPNPEYKCVENETEYGRCWIVHKLDPDDDPEPVNCNDYPAGTPYKVNGKEYPLKNDDGTNGCPSKPKYNYDIDAVCENCNGTNGNGSFQVQDTADWNAILHSYERNDNKSLQTHFSEDGSLFCREEYKIVYPNGVTVSKMIGDSGRYYTVNKYYKDEDKEKVVINDISDFHTIKVSRTKQCISKNPELSLNDKKVFFGDVELSDASTESFELDDIDSTSDITSDENAVNDDSEGSSENDEYDDYDEGANDDEESSSRVDNEYECAEDDELCNSSKEVVDENETTEDSLTSIADKNNADDYIGKIKLIYEEIAPTNSKYNKAIDLVPFEVSFTEPTVENQKAEGYSVVSSTATAYYKLADDVYRYVTPGTVTIDGKTFEPGESSFNKPSETDGFRSMGTANLPISITNNKGSTFTLQFQFPTVSKLGDVIENNEGKPDALDPDSDQPNVYNSKYAGNSACAKMYGSNSSCSSRTDRAAALAESTKCLSMLLGTGDSKYICTVSTKDNSDPGDPPGNQDHRCDVVDGTYYGKNGDNLNEKFSNDVNKAENQFRIECQGNVLIYRTIDLQNAFPGQKAVGRKTGGNWCYSNGL